VEQATEASERQSHHVEVTPLDASDKFSGTALNGVGAGFAHGLASGGIGGDLARSERGEGDARGFDGGQDARAARAVREVQERESGEDAMRAAGEETEHAAGVGMRGGFAKDAVACDDYCVRAEDDGGTADAARGGECFFAGEAGGEASRGFAAAGRFVHGSADDAEGDAGLAEDFRAARRGGGEDEAGMM